MERLGKGWQMRASWQGRGLGGILWTSNAQHVINAFYSAPQRGRDRRGKFHQFQTSSCTDPICPIYKNRLFPVSFTLSCLYWHPRWLASISWNSQMSSNLCTLDSAAMTGVLACPTLSQPRRPSHSSCCLAWLLLDLQLR